MSLMHLNIQSNWYEVESFYLFDDQSIDNEEFKVQCVDNECTCSNREIAAEMISKDTLKVTYKDQEFTYKKPALYRSIKETTIHNADLSPLEDRYLYTGNSEKIFQFSYPDEKVNEIEGHTFETTVAKYFPSGKVVLSGGYDHTLKIWSVNGTCARTNKDFSYSINAIDIIKEGKSVLGGDSHGHVRVVECGRNLSVFDDATYKYLKYYDPMVVDQVYSCHYMEGDSPFSNTIGVSSHYGLHFWSQTSSEHIFSIESTDIQDFLLLHSNLFFIQQGSLHQYDIRDLDHPVQVVPYTSLRLTKLAQYEDSLLLSENDGTVSVISLDQIETKSTSVHTYLTGCDQSINSLVYRSKKEKNLLVSSPCEIAFYDL